MNRVVLDTNVVVSGFLWEGPPSRILETARTKTLAVLSSEALLTELIDVLARAKFSSRLAAINRTAMALVNEYRALIEVVTPAIIPPVIIADLKAVERPSPP